MVIILGFNIILNSVVCFILFSLCSATINVIFEKYKVVALSILDGVIISTIDLLSLSLFGNVFVYFILFSCSCIVLFYPIKLQKVILLELVLLAYILLGWGLNYLLQIIFFNIFRITLKSFIAFGCIRGLIICLFGFVVYCFFRINYRKKHIMDFMYDVELAVAGSRIKLRLFLDSGNSLYDDGLSGLPILIVSKTVIEQKLGEKINMGDLRQVSYSTINGGSSYMPVFEPDNILVFTKENQNKVKAVVGVVDIDFKSYDGLLHSSLI